MYIQTKYLGEMEVSNERVLNFPWGMPGFAAETMFVLLHMPGDSVFQILQSVNTPAVAFIVVNPYHFYTAYEIDLDPSLVESLKIEQESDVVVLTIVTVKDPLSTSTVNLKAPVIINAKYKLGKQYILNTDNYHSKTSLAMPASPEVKGEQQC